MNSGRSIEMGRQGEDAAIAYLADRGYTIITRNYRIRGGEIDVIAKRGDDIVFIEVKTRSRTTYGYPEQAVDARKGRMIARTMHEFVRRNRVPASAYLRFDILALQWDVRMGGFDIRHITNVELPT